MTSNIAWPVKIREFHNHHFDSTVWNDFQFRDDDVVIATYAKAGTTWMQQIVGQLIFGGDPTLEAANLSPWLDIRIVPKEQKFAMLDAQQHRRFIKTHLPLDALVYSAQAKYVYIARDARDVVWSMYNHHANALPQWYDALNNTPGLVGPPIEPPPDDIHQYWRDWMDQDGHPFWPFWESVRSWWAVRHLPNLLMVHFNDLRADLPGQMRRIANFLEIEADGDNWDSIVEYCTFDWMKSHAATTAPMGGAMWEGGGETFINKGTNGRWRDILTAEEIREYERKANSELGEACARWLANGGTII
ncbi:MAG: sulfotransferase domain-containing protein [Gammaproteobacteria bacterium]|nr:MAG: sulfotransferase domain-containing protein [Gammaproteobacteria bacterium]